MKNFLNTLGSWGTSPSSHEALPCSNRPGKPDPAPEAMGSRIQCVVSDCHLTYFSSFQFSTKWGKPNLSSKQSPGKALFLQACLMLPHITHSEQDTLSLFPTRVRPHSSVCPESQPRQVVVADSLLWRQILKKQ